MGYAKRTHHLAPEGAYQVLAKAGQMEAAGKDIIHFEIGQPDYDTFDNVSLAGIRAISEGKTRYTHPAGIVPLREAMKWSSVPEGSRISFSRRSLSWSPGTKSSTRTRDSRRTRR